MYTAIRTNHDPRAVTHITIEEDKIIITVARPSDSIITLNKNSRIFISGLKNAIKPEKIQIGDLINCYENIKESNENSS